MKSKLRRLLLTGAAALYGLSFFLPVFDAGGIHFEYGTLGYGLVISAWEGVLSPFPWGQYARVVLALALLAPATPGVAECVRRNQQLATERDAGR